MKKIYIILFLLVGITNKMLAQIDYTFSAVAGTYTAITGTTATLTDLSGYGTNQEGFQNDIPLGFTFNYNGINYTTVGFNANGFAYLGTIDGSTPDPSSNNLSGSSNLSPVLAPFWDDIQVQTAADMKFTSSGTAPNRVFTLQWSNAIVGYYVSAPSLSFQVKLYETTNIIEFVYQQLPGAFGDITAGGDSGGGSIGIASVTSGSGNFISVQSAAASPAISKTNEVNNISTKPPNGQIYRFTPTSNLPITFTDFKAERVGAVINVYWTTLTEINNKGFEIEKSADGKIFSNLAFIASQSASGFSNNRLQYRFADTKALAIGNYYRFKQIDKDGKPSYSSVVYVKGMKSSVFALRTLIPNPAKDKLTVALQSPFAGNISLIVADVSGKIIKRQVTNIVAGDNLVDVDVAALPSGTYFIKASCSEGCEATYKQFSKQ